jgi:tellurite resistance protein
MTADELAKDVEQARRARVDAMQYARAITVRRNQEEREGILRAAFLVASATGTMSAERLDQVKGLPAALGISEERFREIIAQMS